MRAVLDTSVLVSAIRSESGAAAEIVRWALLGKLTLLLDYKLACEYRDVVLRPEHTRASNKTAREAEEVIDALEAIAFPVLVEVKHLPLSRDEDDDMVLDVAINGGADVVITNNVKDFSPAAAGFGIKILTPGEFLAELREGGF